MTARATFIFPDTGNHRIRKIDASGIITTVAGTGSPGFSGDGGPAIQAQLYAPVGLAVDSMGNLYIAEDGNHRVRKVTFNQNQSPNCNEAVPTPLELWPPGHQMVPIAILGVTDPDGDPVSLTITGITQDEPVNGLGDGDASPDGKGVSTDTAFVRAERAGIREIPGNGRVYEISFSASDGRGGECQGSVRVCVPHDRRPGHVCVDDGQLFDSTQP